jgi:hypothetical protein
MGMNANVLFATIASLGMTSVFIGESYAACNATVNGWPMSPQDCALAIQIYGYVEPGHYWLDQQGNWGRIGVPYAQGNLYMDAQSGGGRASDSDGMTCYSSGGCIGGGYFWDRETGATVGP